MKGLKEKLHYRWVIVGACFLLGFFCLGFCSGNKSLYLAAVTEALDIPRSLFSISDSLRYITSSAMHMAFGTLLHRLGARKMVTAGIACLIAQALVNATATSIWGFYAGGILLGMGLTLCTTTMISTLIRRWCPQNTGRILGMTLAANGVGGAVAAQIVSPIIYREGQPFGYRNAYLLMAAMLLVVGLIVVPLLRDHPKEGTILPTGKKAPKSRDWVGMDYSEARRTPYFIPAVACIFITGVCLQGITGISSAHMKDTGIHPDHVATVISAHALMLAASKFLTGYSYDRFGMRTTVILCDVAAVLATAVLANTGTSALGMGLTYGYAVLSGLALPLETIMLSLFASELFGNRAFPHTLGVFAAVNTAGCAVGIPLANWIFDALGTYVPVILTYSGIMLAVTVVFQFILSAAYRDRRKILAREAAAE